MSPFPISVLKFGSSVLRSRRDLAAVVHAIYRELRAARRVVAVVSAAGGTTDRLLARARAITPDPDPLALAGYLATGEARSAAELVFALQRAGVSATALDVERAGLRAEGARLEASLVAVDARAIERAFAEHSVVVVPGFTARDAHGAPVLLGRGGSDLTALFLGAALPGARIRLEKDVEGVYERDPADARGTNRRYAEIGFVDALRVAGSLVQEKALRFAFERNLAFEVGRLDSPAATLVGARATRFAAPATPARALRVVLLGLGTVGLGVYRELAARPDLFDVRSILVRRRTGRSAARVPAELLATTASRAGIAAADVVVELVGGEEPARTLVHAALERGVDVVCANKPLLVEHGRLFHEIAARTGARLLASASVGGAVPMLETVRALAAAEGIARFEGVLNATTNYVLDRLSEGATFESALGLATRHGYCEANPWADLSGADAAHKLELLAREAFGAHVEIEWTERAGIDALEPAGVRRAREGGRVVRLVAECWRDREGRVRARLGPRELDACDALARVTDAGNALTVETWSGASRHLAGQGAGRWPTTEAVLGDLLELARTRTTPVPAGIAS